MAKKKTVKSVHEDTFDYDKPRSPIELYLAKALGENVTLPDTDNERILVYLRKLIEVIEESGGGTEVIANPTLAGTEDALTGLQVGDAKYKIDGGISKLYRRNYIWGGNYGGMYREFHWEVYSTTNEAIPRNNPNFLTLYDLKEYLKNKYPDMSSNPSAVCRFLSTPSNSGALNDAMAYFLYFDGSWSVWYYDNSTSAYTTTSISENASKNVNVSETILQII